MIRDITEGRFQRKSDRKAQESIGKQGRLAG